MSIPIWERYFFREILKVFFLFLIAFYFVYALMDYSSHMQDFIKDKKIQLLDLVQYYMYQFVKRSGLLVPLALLVSTIKVLSSFNAHRELVALQTAGLKLKTLFRPFLVAAFICTLFNYLSFEFFLPRSLNYIDRFHDAHFRHSYRGNRKEPIHIVPLENNTKLIYQLYDVAKGVFFDASWIISADELFRIKYLKVSSSQPAVGEYVDHLKRNDQGILEKVESFTTYPLHALKWKKDIPRKGAVPFENRSLSELFSLLTYRKTHTLQERIEVKTQFWYKATVPLLPFLVVIASAPFCVLYRRNAQVFFIYAIALFGYITFYALIDAFVILGENQAISPFFGIAVPSVLVGGAFAWKFAKTN